MTATARLALVTLGTCYPGRPLRDGDPRLEHMMTSAAAAQPEPRDSERRSTKGATMRGTRRRDMTALIA